MIARSTYCSTRLLAIIGTPEGHIWASYLNRSEVVAMPAPQENGMPASPAPEFAPSPDDGPASMQAASGRRPVGFSPRRSLLAKPLCNIVGYDNRKEYHDHNSPWCQVGFLGSGCSATLIGRRTLLTAGGYRSALGCVGAG